MSDSINQPAKLKSHITNTLKVYTKLQKIHFVFDQGHGEIDA
jgi:hypothetical protein